MTTPRNRQKLHEAMASLGASRVELARLLDTPRRNIVCRSTHYIELPLRGG